MPNTPTFTPTTKRGADLAEEVLDVIEVEAKLFKGLDFDELEHHKKLNKGNAWDQSTWAEVVLNKLPAGTNIELLPSDLAGSSGYAAIDSGVVCGTAMCFAGHASTLAGDKLVVYVGSRATEELTEKGKRKVRGLLRTMRAKFDSDFGTNGEGVSRVLTPEGKVMDIEDRARQLLGMDRESAHHLFGGDNDLNQIRDYVRQYRDTGRITPFDDFSEDDE